MYLFSMAFCRHASSPFEGDPITDSEFVVPTTLDLPEFMAHLCYLGTYQGVCPAARERLSLLFFPWPVIHQEQVQPRPAWCSKHCD